MNPATLLGGVVSTTIAVLLAAPRATVPSPASAPQAISIETYQELFVKTIHVVDDARASGLGPWSFGGLMTSIAGDHDPGDFASWWLQTWECPQTVNDVPVFDKNKGASMRAFRQTWEALDPAGELDLAQSPFRLCAIVNRPDLVKVDAQGGVTSAGELRFVFCHKDFASGVGRSFFVIFEFQVPASSAADVLAYQQGWHALGGYDLEDPAQREPFRAALEEITTAVTDRDDENGRPNGSNLAQLRINEFDLPSGPAPACAATGGKSNDWDLREFALVAAGGGSSSLATLENATVKQTPHIQYLGAFCQMDMLMNCILEVRTDPARDLLGEYLEQNEDDILDGVHVVPDYYPFASGWRTFQSGHAPNRASQSPRPPYGKKDLSTAGATLWWATGYDGLDEAGTGPWTRRQSDVRHLFALQTCSGCHHSETGTIPPPNDFSMVSERNPGAESSLSGFLEGVWVTDPVNPDVSDEPDPVMRYFHDLARRADVLRDILASGTGGGAAQVLLLQQIQAAMGTRVH